MSRKLCDCVVLGIRIDPILAVTDLRWPHRQNASRISAVELRKHPSNKATLVGTLTENEPVTLDHEASAQLGTLRTVTGP